MFFKDTKQFVTFSGDLVEIENRLADQCLPFDLINMLYRWANFQHLAVNADFIIDVLDIVKNTFVLDLNGFYRRFHTGKGVGRCLEFFINRPDRPMGFKISVLDSVGLTGQP